MPPTTTGTTPALIQMDIKQGSKLLERYQYKPGSPDERAAQRKARHHAQYGRTIHIGPTH